MRRSGGSEPGAKNQEDPARRVPSSDRSRAKGRRDGGAFHALPCDIINSANHRALTPKACKLFFDLLRQIRLKRGGPVNNGDLTVAFRVLRESGWKSRQQIEEARDELEHYGFVVQTRQGGQNRASLYAFTWWSINLCSGKLDSPYRRENPVAPGGWKDPKPPFVPKRKIKSLTRQSCQFDPPVVPMRGCVAR